jgi:hypothetical protein
MPRFKKPVRVPRISRCRVRAVRSSEANKTGKKAARIIAQLLELRTQKRSHLIRVILDSTSTVDNKTKAAGIGH